MDITLFTSNKSRHNYLINLLSNICDNLFVIQETSTIFPGLVPGNYAVSKVLERYFKEVNLAQEKIFDNSYINNNKTKVLPMQWGDLSKCSLPLLKDFLKSDIYIIFGSSYIKGQLLHYLSKRKALNIHMGVSPYYRGTDCNFWALFDENPHLVGATIHLLSSGLDNGPILYHALSNIKTTPFEYTMYSVKSAFYSLIERVKDKSIFKLKPSLQDHKKEIRYSKKVDFKESVVKDYFQRNIDLNYKSFNYELLKDPYFLK